jgi:hypothetical protein
MSYEQIIVVAPYVLALIGLTIMALILIGGGPLRQVAVIGEISDAAAVMLEQMGARLQIVENALGRLETENNELRARVRHLESENSQLRMSVLFLEKENEKLSQQLKTIGDS